MRFFPALLVLAFTAPLMAQDFQVHAPPRTISTSGEAIVYVVPDEVVVMFGVATFNAELDKAKAENDERSARLLKAVKALGVEDKHVQTDTLRVGIHYTNDHFHIEGYSANRIYSVTLKDPKLFEKCIDTVLKSGANQFSGFEFKTTELRKYRDQADTKNRISATTDANGNRLASTVDGS